MKKVLFGTTALIAAASFAGAAQAEKIKLSIGGKQEMYFGFADINDDQGEVWDNAGMATDTELYFTGSTTLDNGITVKAIIQLEAEDNGDRNADEQAIQLSGGFGALQIGQRQGFVGQMQYLAPSAGGSIGADETEDHNWVEYAWDLNNYYTGDDLSVSYVTPSFFGFSLAATYAPDSSDGDDATFVDWTSAGAADYKDLLAIGGAFDNEFNGVGIHGDFTYQHQFASRGGIDRALIRGGASVSYMGFELGGSYGYWDYDADDMDKDAWAVGAAYANGPYGVAFVFQDKNDENGGNDVDTQTLQFSGNYVLGPGINLGAAVFHGNEEADNGWEREATGMFMGIGLSF